MKLVHEISTIFLVFVFLMVPWSVFAEESEFKTSDCISGCSLPAMIQDNGLESLVGGRGF